MKKILLLLIALPMFGIGQQTYVPDDNFEDYLEANGIGNGIANDDSVTTASIDTVTYLNVSSQLISDLTGIEDFTALDEMDCRNNNLISLDISSNIFLFHLNCSNNQLISLDFSQNVNFGELGCYNNQLTSLDLRNGSTSPLYIDEDVEFYNNPNLFCIDVEDTTYCNANWTVANNIIDPQHYFSNNCSGATVIQEHTTNKELLKITDLLGRETKATKNEVLFYICNDGTVEKRIVIE